MDEIWKDIQGFEDYQISNKGRVYSKKRNIIKKLNTNNKGYLHCSFTKNGKSYTKKIHRLVANAFIPNPNNLPIVNHKDENKINNCVENLEWCTDDYNRHYGSTVERAGKGHYKKIAQYSLDGEFIKEWNGIIEASRTLKINATHIVDCCKGRLNKTGGYMWKYVEKGD